jgi:CRP/FNR family transcriptional regulator, cyclic AMP receptor protein
MLFGFNEAITFAHKHRSLQGTTVMLLWKRWLYFTGQLAEKAQFPEFTRTLQRERENRLAQPCFPVNFALSRHLKQYLRDCQRGLLFCFIQSCEYPVCYFRGGRQAFTPRPFLPTMKPRKLPKNGIADSFNAQDFLDTAGVARKIEEYRRGESIYSQGDAAETVMYVQNGGVKLSVVNGSGKEAVVAMFGPTDFFGEGCMAGQTVRMGTTSAVTPTTLLVIQKKELLRALHAEHELSDHFIAYMLARNIRVEEDLIDQLFNSSEKRLARTLLLLARYGKQEQPDRILPKVSQDTLARMVGTTRSRVNFFMNKFRKLGFIEYNGKIKVNKSLLTVVLHE